MHTWIWFCAIPNYDKHHDTNIFDQDKNASFVVPFYLAYYLLSKKRKNTIKRVRTFVFNQVLLAFMPWVIYTS
jgi:hypothetical protein